MHGLDTARLGRGWANEPTSRRAESNAISTVAHSSQIANSNSNKPPYNTNIFTYLCVVSVEKKINEILCCLIEWNARLANALVFTSIYHKIPNSKFQKSSTPQFQVVYFMYCSDMYCERAKTVVTKECAAHRHPPTYRNVYMPKWDAVRIRFMQSISVLASDTIWNV